VDLNAALLRFVAERALELVAWVAAIGLIVWLWRKG